MKKKLTLGLSALALVTAGAAVANHHGGKHNPDADGNGVVTRSEATAHAAQKFARLDANNDGVIDQTDRAARRTERRTKMFDKLDTDSNGQISRTEFMSFEGRGHGERDGKHRMGRRGGGHGGKMMRGADANNDGSISQAEFTAAGMSRFDRMDANNDGQITAEERQAAREQRREKRQERRQNRSES